MLTDAIILNESRAELSPVREHYGGPRQLHLRLKLRSKDLAVCPDLVKAIKRYLITEYGPLGLVLRARIRSCELLKISVVLRVNLCLTK